MRRPESGRRIMSLDSDGYRTARSSVDDFSAPRQHQLLPYRSSSSEATGAVPITRKVSFAANSLSPILP